MEQETQEVGGSVTNRRVSFHEALAKTEGGRRLSSSEDGPPRSKDRDNGESTRSLILGRMKSRRRMSNRMSFAEKEHIELEGRNSSQLKWWHAVFFFSGISVLFCLLQLFLPYPYGLMMTSAQIEEVGIAPDGCEGGLERCICPRETICATNKVSIILLALARCSAFFDYPLYMMMFLSKCHNINNICRRTVLREWVDFADMHMVHRIFGIVVGIETMSHSFFHMLRWGLNYDISFVWTTATGITGLVAAIVTSLIVWPMVIPPLKHRLPFELRKGLHYLWIVWAIALVFHAPSRIYYLIGIPALLLLIDYLFGYFVRNTLIENAYCERYGENGVALHFQNPDSWDKELKTSYVYVMCPWISKYQWHAFTIFPEPRKKNHTMLCIANSGDWTKAMHEKIKVPCFRPLYVLGPYKSQFSDTAITTSNAIAVASGIGITPTLSLVLNYAGKKRINIVWMCRDPGLVEHILHRVDVGEITAKSFAFIFYTGKRELALPKTLPVNVFIFKSRPHLEHTITGIITAIHSGEGLPEEMYELQKTIADTPFYKRMKMAMSRVVEIYGESEMFEYAVEMTEKEPESHIASLESSDITDDTDTEAASLGNGDAEVVPLRSSLRRSSLDVSDFIPEGEISLRGLDAMILEFLGGIGEYSRSDIVNIFRQIDTDGSGFIDREEFGEFIRIVTAEVASDMRRESSREMLAGLEKIMSRKMLHHSSHHSSLDNSSVHSNRRQNVTSSSKGTSRNSYILGDETTIRYVQTLVTSSRSSHSPLEDWSVFYCGGSDAIKNNLKTITQKYNMDLAVEMFDW